MGTFAPVFPAAWTPQARGRKRSRALGHNGESKPVSDLRSVRTILGGV